MNQKEPYSALHIFLVMSAPVWMPLLLFLWLLGFVLGTLFMIVCGIGGAIVVLFGSFVETVGRLARSESIQEMGLDLRDIGTRTIKFGGETFKEMGF